MIETQTSPDSSTVVCRPSGKLDDLGAMALRHLIADLVRPSLDLVVDLSRVTFVDSVGISVLVGTVRRVRNAGGAAQVVGACPSVQRLFDLVGVDQLLAENRSSNSVP